MLDDELPFTLFLICSAAMDTHYVPPVKVGYTTGAPLVDKSLAILGV